MQWVNVCHCPWHPLLSHTTNTEPNFSALLLAIQYLHYTILVISLLIRLIDLVTKSSGHPQSIFYCQNRYIPVNYSLGLSDRHIWTISIDQVPSYLFTNYISKHEPYWFNLTWSGCNGSIKPRLVLYARSAHQRNNTNATNSVNDASNATL